MAEHAGPCSWRENLPFKDRKNSGWGNERQFRAGGFGDSDSWQLQVSSRVFQLIPLDVFHLKVMSQALFVLCSLTWTDAHLHRQLITVLHGPVVDSFDSEFRILFAASLPVRSVAGTHVDMTNQLKGFPDLQFKKQVSLEPEITYPPSPPADSFLDWEVMGVVQWFPDNTKGIPLQNSLLFDKNTAIMDHYDNSGNQFLDMKRYINHLDLIYLSASMK